MTRHEELLEKCIQLRDDIDNFVSENHEHLDGEVWDSLEMESKYIRQDMIFLGSSGGCEYLTSTGLDLVEQRNKESRVYFEQEQANLVEHLEQKAGANLQGADLVVG